MIRKNWIRKHVKDLSFVDVGALFGVRNENLSDARSAKSITLIDKLPLSDPAWQVMRDYLKFPYEEISDDVCNVKRSFGMVNCGGVIYHHPDPKQILTALKNITNKYLIITTTFTQSVIENDKGKVEVKDYLYMPDIDDKTREVVKEDWREFLRDKPASGLVYVDDWTKNILDHWWWLFTEDYLVNLFKTLELNIVEKAIEGKTISFLLKPVQRFLI